jgi:Na+/H+ antiporter NhaA
MDLAHWVNDGLMVLFFFVIGLEIRREISIGELTEKRRLILPAAGALGGLLVPVFVYLALNPTGEAARGWGIVIGTDTAFLLGALALVGPAHSTRLRVFLLTMTIVDDVLAISIIGAVYSESLDATALAVAAACVFAFGLLGQMRVWQTSLYGLVGLVLWVATVESGLHASIAGMAAGLLIPAHEPQPAALERVASLFRAFLRSPKPRMGYSAKIGLQRAVSVNERLQMVWHPWTSYYIVPLFAFANAGVDLRGGLLGEALRSPVTWGVVIGLVGGKLAGIPLAILGAAHLGWGTLPRGVSAGHILGGAALSGIGFTVSLLIAGLAFEDAALKDQATVGVLVAAVVSTLVGSVIFRLAESRGVSNSSDATPL